MSYLTEIAIERPIGTEGNNKILELIKNELKSSKYTMESLNFKCLTWDNGNSYIKLEDNIYTIYASPFSKGYKGEGKVICCSKISDLKNPEIENNILILDGEITENPLMPKNFPFYFPEEHAKLYDLIEKAKPACILALTGKSALSGLDPYPFFEDGNFLIPSAYVSNKSNFIKTIVNKDVEISINSKIQEAKSEQLIFKKKGTSKDTILICAHMDSKYGTLGALDNASGIYTILEVAKKLDNVQTTSNVEIVPFNGEEYYGVTGQLKYLEYLKKQNINIKLVINIDSAGYKSSNNALSFYNISEDDVNKIINKYNVVLGTEWYAGDHAMFAFQGTPCIVATSSDLFEKGIFTTHTYADTLENVDENLLDELANNLYHIILDFDNKK
ncbi:aminopeptidase YwaD [Methanococcus voltae]|uniref:M28 family peptidase n=1 Tax=Methanococcus voltae TaxID=2188 RepID=UPI001AE525DE|nr:M28 family peptidase [Methanococcus voltae]MBP2144545.1 aminopeptidase YwaD [Methanococcus voltae]